MSKESHITPRSSVDPLVGALLVDRERRKIAVGWKIMTAVGLLLASLSIFVSVASYVAINHDRARNVRRNCEDTNQRNHDTITKLDAELARLKASSTPAQAKEIERSRDFTVKLINALQPHHNCDTVVRIQVR